MQNHINKVLTLLKPYWIKNKELSLLNTLTQICNESQFVGLLNELQDDQLIAHLQQAYTEKNETIHLIDEVLELLEPYWVKNSSLNLLALLDLLREESGFAGTLDKLTDEVVIYQLKMDQTKQGEMIPGIKKDCEDDFQTALLKARGLI